MESDKGAWAEEVLMKMHSRFSRSIRVVIIVVGVVVVFAGLMGRALEQEYPDAEGAADEIAMLEDGSWVAYQVVESGSSYEVGSVDESTYVVYEIPNDTDSRTEVYRGTEDGAHEFMVASTRAIVFDGTRSEVLARQEAEREAARNMTIPNVTIIVGLVVITLGIAGGWSRRDEATDPESVEQPGSLLT